MRLTETLRMIWTNLLQNKSKVLLTSLGIIIGTLTIILVIAIGKGGEEEVARQYSSMSAETIYVNVIYSDRLDFASIPRISTEHLAVILEGYICVLHCSRRHESDRKRKTSPLRL